MSGSSNKCGFFKEISTKTAPTRTFAVILHSVFAQLECSLQYVVQISHSKGARDTAESLFCLHSKETTFFLVILISLLSIHLRNTVVLLFLSALAAMSVFLPNTTFPAFWVHTNPGSGSLPLFWMNRLFCWSLRCL